MREDYHILPHVMAGYLSYGSGKTLRGLLGCFTAQHKLSRMTKKAATAWSNSSGPSQAVLLRSCSCSPSITRTLACMC